MRRAIVKAAIIEAIEKMGLAYLWQDKPCKLFVVIGGHIKAIELGKVRSQVAFERVMGRLEGWQEMMAA
jgi:hypothetical protein